MHRCEAVSWPVLQPSGAENPDKKGKQGRVSSVCHPYFSFTRRTYVPTSHIPNCNCKIVRVVLKTSVNSQWTVLPLSLRSLNKVITVNRDPCKEPED